MTVWFRRCKTGSYVCLGPASDGVGDREHSTGIRRSVGETGERIFGTVAGIVEQRPKRNGGIDAFHGGVQLRDGRARAAKQCLEPVPSDSSPVPLIPVLAF